MSKKINVLASVLLSLVLGIVLSSSTYFVPRDTTSPLDSTSCIGPAVVGYQCPSSLTHKERGFPIKYYVNDFDNRSDGSSEARLVPQYLLQKFILNTAIWSILLFAVIRLSNSQSAKKV
jgi:hypothetical protein